MSDRQTLFSSESVGIGHPDKVADCISDAIVDALIAQDKMSRIACETLVTTGMALIAGEITTQAENVDYPEIVRDVIRRIGYTKPEYHFAADSCAVLVTLDRQSPDIAQGVDRDTPEHQGAGDQGMMFGFACKDTPQLMPLPITLAHAIMQKAHEVQKSGALSFMRPDGKCQVTVRYDGLTPVGLETIVLSHQHDDGISHDELERAFIETIIKPVLPEKFAADNIKYHINPTGKFVVGGPHGDCGLTGRKNIVDTYGGRGAHGGGAFSGKDPSKVDRSAAYAARHVAKNIVAAGLADVCEVQVAYAIGVADPVSIAVDTSGTNTIPEERIAELVSECFDLHPGAIIKNLDLLRPIYSKTTAFGHFGREEPEFGWEKTDKADMLRDKAGL